MARFLFVIVPVVARLWPAVAIGDALAAGGHDVAWCGPESDLRPLLPPDATIYPTGKRSYREFREVGMAAVRELWDEYVLPLNRFIQGSVDRAVAQYRPDVVVADQYALAGALAAHKHGLRWASLCAGILELAPPDGDASLQEWVRAKLMSAWAAAGVPADARIDLRFSPYLVIGMTSKALTGAVPLPEHCVLVGAALGSRRTDPSFSWDWWDPGRRHVLVTAGTLSAHLVHDFLARMMAALEPMACRVQAVVNAGTTTPAPPPHILFAPRLPMLDLMPRLDAVICQAGQSTVNEALAHGVPLVVAPIRLGELTVADQVTRAGAGIRVSFAAATPARLAAAVTAVLEDPGYRGNARRIGAEFSTAGGTGAAARQLAALAAGRPGRAADYATIQAVQPEGRG
ncbi:MAG: glycosyltransferase [Streptosporangiaceae bacterium]